MLTLLTADATTNIKKITGFLYTLILAWLAWLRKMVQRPCTSKEKNQATFWTPSNNNNNNNNYRINPSIHPSRTTATTSTATSGKQGPATSRFASLQWSWDLPLNDTPFKPWRKRKRRRFVNASLITKWSSSVLSISSDMMEANIN